MKKIQNDKGVTIIALSITIIILFILAGISIDIIVGENGLITKAEGIKSDIEKAEYEGQTKINNLKEEKYTQDGTVNLEDEEPPTINSIEVVISSDTSFIVNVNITEIGSGLNKVEYSIDDGENYVTPDITENPYTYTFENLKIGFEEYKVKVRATDLNGNISYASKTIGKTKSEN